MQTGYSRQVFKFLGIGIMLLFFLSSCGTKKHLRPDQAYLNKNIIVFDTKDKIKNKQNLKYELSTLIKQKPNEKFLGLFRTRLWFYYNTQEPGDTTKLDKWKKRVIAEPPSIYNKELAVTSAEAMKFYLQNKGYFDAEVSYDSKNRRKKADITFKVKPNKLYQIGNVRYRSDDPNIQAILNDIKNESHLNQGTAVDGKIYDLEVNRVTKALRNRGYADFYTNFVAPLEGDSLYHQVDVVFEVLTPEKAAIHATYTIGDITIYPRFEPSQTLRSDPDTIINDIKFIMGEAGEEIKYRTILDEIYLRKGDLYHQDDIDKTKKQLGQLGIFKFVTVRQEKDSLDNSKINFHIQLTPSKKLGIGYDIELNNSQFDVSSTNATTKTTFFGTSLSLNFRNRNLRKGAELFILSLQGGVDLNVNNDDIPLIYSLNFKAQTDLYLHKFSDPFRLWKFGNTLNLLSKGFYKDLKEKGNTHFTLGYEYVSIFNFYNFNVFKASFGYELQRNDNNAYRVNQVAIDYLNPKRQQGFEDIAANNPFLDKSVRKQLFTGVLFRDFTYTHTSNVNRFGESWFFRLNTELSGMEVFIANKIYNGGSTPFGFVVNGSSGTDKDTILFAEFATLDFDIRHYRKFSPKHTIALRYYSGIAFPYGTSDEVPYVKQFHVGGPTSIRAWRIRELGPGSYVDPIQQDSTISFYQTGDFKIEFNAEYRFDMFWRLKGAIFLDGGNIWTLNDADRPGSELTTRFWKQIALGTGLGFRIDFAYFIIRLDMGLKIKNPYQDEEGSYWEIRKLRNQAFFQSFNYNLAIGYPF